MILNPYRHPFPLPLADREAILAAERALQDRLPPHTLMARAGWSACRLARALAPHARTAWVACGPGNNGGDGLVAALFLGPWLRQNGGVLHVTWLGGAEKAPADARWAYETFRAAGGIISTEPPSGPVDLGIDALLGLGGPQPRAEAGALGAHMALLRAQSRTLLCLDAPSDLHPWSGHSRWPLDRIPLHRATHTLTYLMLKPGLVTGLGRDLAGTLWLDDLRTPDPQQPELPGVAGHAASFPSSPADLEQAAPSLSGQGPAHWLPPAMAWPARALAHHGHKGLRGSVWVVGADAEPEGQVMHGALLLAARAAALAGAGRVTGVALDPHAPALLDALHPELMARRTPSPPQPADWPEGVWVLGCGGGQRVAQWLQPALESPRPLVLDADALNHLAQQPGLGQALTARRLRGAVTVLTPHPLEAARLLECSTAAVQADRLAAARSLAQRWASVVVLKGSGTVVASPSGACWINGTGNSLLATAGSGDVLAGLLGGLLAQALLQGTAAGEPHATETTATQCALRAVHAHGAAADHWPAGKPLVAAHLPEAAARALSPLGQ